MLDSFLSFSLPFSWLSKPPISLQPFYRALSLFAQTLPLILSSFSRPRFDSRVSPLLNPSTALSLLQPSFSINLSFSAQSLSFFLFVFLWLLDPFFSRTRTAQNTLHVAQSFNYNLCLSLSVHFRFFLKLSLALSLSWPISFFDFHCLSPILEISSRSFTYSTHNSLSRPISLFLVQSLTFMLSQAVFLGLFKLSLSHTHAAQNTLFLSQSLFFSLSLFLPRAIYLYDSLYFSLTCQTLCLSYTYRAKDSRSCNFFQSLSFTFNLSESLSIFFKLSPSLSISPICCLYLFLTFPLTLSLTLQTSALIHTWHAAQKIAEANRRIQYDGGEGEWGKSGGNRSGNQSHEPR